MAAMSRDEARLAVLVDILADPEWTARVVAAAIVAQDVLERDHPAFDVLWDATRDRSRRTV